jgi:hypothetical protein
MKASLHQSGNWHIAYTHRFFEDNVASVEGFHPTRFIEQWPRPKEIAPGVTLAFRIVTPSSAVNTPFDQSRFPHFIWIPSAPDGNATEVDMIITAPTTPVTGWPGKRSVGTQLVGSMPLDSGETVWVVWWVIEMPKLPTVRTKPKYYKRRGPDGFKGKQLRALVFGSENDGSRVLYDCAVQVTKHGN